MSTGSITHNVVIDDPEKAENLAKALEGAEAYWWSWAYSYAYDPREQKYILGEDKTITKEEFDKYLLKVGISNDDLDSCKTGMVLRELWDRKSKNK